MPSYNIDRLKADVPCSSLLEKAGWKVDLRESTPKAMKYRRGEGEIVIVVHQGRGWFDPTSDAKGDVLDLAEHLGAPNFSAALKTVAKLVGFEPTAPAWQRRSTKNGLGEIERRWTVRPNVGRGSAAWSYLTLQRAIPESVVLGAIAAGKLKEGPKGTVWAAHMNSMEQVTGWEERGSEWRGFSSGGAKTLFSLGANDALRLCVTEAAIDAMSLAAIELSREDSLYVSTGGGWSPITADRIASLAARPGSHLVAACDGNDQGDVYAARLKQIAEQAGAEFIRLWPEAEDWNEQLREIR